MLKWAKNFNALRERVCWEIVVLILSGLNSVGGNPVQEERDLSVDTRVASQSAALTPGDDSVLDGAVTSASEEGAARVTLARVDSTVGDVTSAQHGLVDLWVRSGATICSVASSIVDDWDIDTAELVGNDSAGAGGSPSGNGNDGSCGRVQFGSGGWQEDGLGLWYAQVQWGIQKEQGDVILKSQWLVVLVHNEASNATVLFETAVGPQAVLTGDDTENGQISDSANAVGSIDDDVFIEDGTTARLGEGASGSTALQRNLEGKRVGCHNGSSDDSVFGDELVFAAHDDRGRQTRKNHALGHSHSAGEKGGKYDDLHLGLK